MAEEVDKYDTLETEVEEEGIRWIGVSSSNINRIAFRAETEEILVEFVDGGQYAYADCSPELFLAFQNASSVGKFFHSNIKDHSFERLN